jgi:hypothetical protein
MVNQLQRKIVGTIFIINHFCATGVHIAYFLSHLGYIVSGQVRSNNFNYFLLQACMYFPSNLLF